MVVTTSADPRAWSAATVDEPGQWYFPLPERLLAELRAMAAAAPADGPITEMVVDDQRRAKWAETVAPVLRDLEEGRGFVIIDRLPLEQMTQREAVAIYWLLGQLLGQPVAQNVQGTLLYDVRDT